MPDKIAPDSTIETVWEKLTHQKPYVSGALQKMRQCTKANGNAQIKIGVTGTGQKPYYRIMYLDKNEVLTIFGSYYDNHEALENGYVDTNNWSTATMSFAELETFYSNAIGYSGKRL